MLCFSLISQGLLRNLVKIIYTYIYKLKQHEIFGLGERGGGVSLEGCFKGLRWFQESGCAMLVRDVFMWSLNHFIMHVPPHPPQQREECVASGHEGWRRNIQSVESPWQSSCSSYGRRSVGVAQHGVEGAGEVVGVVAAVVLLGHRHQAGQADEEQEDEMDGERGPEDSQQEGLTLRGGRGGGGRGGGGDAIRKVKTGGSATSGALWFAPAAGRHTNTQVKHGRGIDPSSLVFANHFWVWKKWKCSNLKGLNQN